jgi:hypothetical protein
VFVLGVSLLYEVVGVFVLGVSLLSGEGMQVWIRRKLIGENNVRCDKRSLHFPTLLIIRVRLPHPHPSVPLRARLRGHETAASV